jgi:hypothetical protein
MNITIEEDKYAPILDILNKWTNDWINNLEIPDYTETISGLGFSNVIWDKENNTYSFDIPEFDYCDIEDEFGFQFRMHFPKDMQNTRITGVKWPPTMDCNLWKEKINPSNPIELEVKYDI